MAKTKGIRSYGPGKFYKLIDSYVYEITLDGGADEEVGLDDSWYGLMRIDDDLIDRVEEIAAERHDKLTEEEMELLESNEALIFFSRSDGIVEADWYSSLQEAEDAWEEIEEDAGGDEDEEYEP